MDSYKTIAQASEGLFKDKGSKFLAFAYPVSGTDEIKSILEQKRKEYHDARHVCYAYMLGAERVDFRSNDDGEPSGTAGKPILGQINSAQISDVLIVVVRYFGGVLLGTSGLIQAYKTAASEAIANAQIIDKIVESELIVEFNYAQMNTVMRVVKELDLTIKEQKQEFTCKLKLCFRKSLQQTVIDRFNLLQIEIIGNK